MRKILTLCVIHKDPHVLLGFKKKGFGAGRWNGFGGKPEEGESIEEAARREVFEEAGVVVSDMEKVGTMEFSFKDKPEVLEVHLFRASDFDGEPVEGEEMRPQWFHIDKLPFDKMWPDDKYWYPLFLQNKKFTTLTGKYHPASLISLRHFRS
jgi:8-oxo-dGTP diphosphatase/2-hydroxy-dATP diphosphatase